MIIKIEFIEVIYYYAYLQGYHHYIVMLMHQMCAKYKDNSQ